MHCSNLYKPIIISGKQLVHRHCIFINEKENEGWKELEFSFVGKLMNQKYTAMSVVNTDK